MCRIAWGFHVLGKGPASAQGLRMHQVDGHRTIHPAVPTWLCPGPKTQKTSEIVGFFSGRNMGIKVEIRDFTATNGILPTTMGILSTTQNWDFTIQSGALAWFNDSPYCLAICGVVPTSFYPPLPMGWWSQVIFICLGWLKGTQMDTLQRCFFLCIESMLLMVENTGSVKACGMLGRVQLIHHPSPHVGCLVVFEVNVLMRFGRNTMGKR